HALREGDTSKAREITDRLLATAVKYEVHKYIGVAHNLMAQIAIAEGDMTSAEAEFGAALAEFKQRPVPVVAWRIHADLGRLRSARGDSAGGRDAFEQAAAIINNIAANVSDATLKENFLLSSAVREVMKGAES
ncbi:MAG TPA: hypothetical protein VNF70_07630, partial [Pyrinomonadaceae bacterium]|nr:hypothetical protein [Pyrinomonadaceae bacterium]